jgi:hypothetical protein
MTINQNTRPRLLTAVGGTQSILLTFDKAVDPATVSLASLKNGYDDNITASGLIQEVAGSGHKQFNVPLSAAPAGGFKLLLSPTVVDFWANPVATPSLIQAIDHIGPKVQGIAVSQSTIALPGGGLAAEVMVLFNEPIDQSTFGTNDITVTDLGGGSVNVLSLTTTSAVNARPGQAFIATVARTLGGGTFRMQVGPDVRDISGNLMDQDQDGVVGIYLRQQALANPKMAISLGAAARSELLQDLFSDTFILGPAQVVGHPTL